MREQVLQNAKEKLQNICLTESLKCLKGKAGERGETGRRKGLKIRPKPSVSGLLACKTQAVFRLKTTEQNEICKTFLIRHARAMTHPTDIRQDILDAANSVAAPGEPVSLVDIGPVLVLEKQYTEHEVVAALYALQDEKVIELLNGNRMRVL